jgi:ATP diphosphatase
MLAMSAPQIPPVARLRAIMARLRDPERGCEWDLAQDFASIAPYTIEEAYEVADAIGRNDLDDLRDELGDLLLQVIFHSRMAEEVGAFDFDDVCTSIADKMERRHPHIFGDDATGGYHKWEALKAAERVEKGKSGALEGVAAGLPALLRAEKLQKRAARVGFDWPNPDGARAKVVEEIAEIDEASGDAERIEEFGDLLFAVVNWARKYGIDAEAALRAASQKFETRFAAMELLVGGTIDGLDLDAQERLWQDVKMAR